MPPKIRELERRLKRAGFKIEPGRGKGSHRVYKHPAVRGVTVTMAGQLGDDADRYQEADVSEALAYVQAQLKKSNN
jgi:predicted RNA binding protein YcfA (HicA-like mRNA interferase family)